MSDVVLVTVEDRVATITLNRPAVRNAINGKLGGTLARAVGDAEHRDDVDVMILAGADPAFCAGADLQEIAAGTSRPAVDADPDDPTGATTSASSRSGARFRPAPSS
jgi:enoyl-CoA hydratase